MTTCPACHNEQWRYPHNCTDGPRPKPRHTPAYFAAITAADALTHGDSVVAQNTTGSASFEWEYVDGRTYRVTVKEVTP